MLKSQVGDTNTVNLIKEATQQSYAVNVRSLLADGSTRIQADEDM